MQSVRYRLAELFIIFVLVPIAFTQSFNTWLKLGIGLVGFIYIIFILLKVEKLKFKIKPNLGWSKFWKTTGVKFLIIALLTTVFVYITAPEALFNVLLNKPLLWVIILFVYSFFSVYPQELIYRTFFFVRYERLFSSSTLFVFLNATIFSLGHIFFKSSLVMVLTFLGGLLFAQTFFKTRSTLMVSVEHAIYGSWLFTVGMGDMLGFPS